jgi:hypothetical protein
VKAGCRESLAGQHFDEHHAKCPDVSARIDLLTPELLWRHVRNRAEHFTRLRLFDAGQFGHAEVNDLDVG